MSVKRPQELFKGKKSNKGKSVIVDENVINNLQSKETISRLADIEKKYDFDGPVKVNKQIRIDKEKADIADRRDKVKRLKTAGLQPHQIAQKIGVSVVQVNADIRFLQKDESKDYKLSRKERAKKIEDQFRIMVESSHQNYIDALDEDPVDYKKVVAYHAAWRSALSDQAKFLASMNLLVKEAAPNVSNGISDFEAECNEMSLEQIEEKIARQDEVLRNLRLKPEDYSEIAKENVEILEQADLSDLAEE